MKLIITEFSAFLDAEHFEMSNCAKKGECSSNYFQCSGKNCSIPTMLKVAALIILRVNPI